MSITATMEQPETSTEMPGLSTVLVFLDGQGRARNGVHLAADAARRQRASLHAVYLDARSPGHSNDQARGDEIAGRRAREAENAARAAAGNFGVPFEWDIDAGDPARITRTVIRLQTDLGVNLQGAALALDLLEQIENLQQQLRRK